MEPRRRGGSGAWDRDGDGERSQGPPRRRGRKEHGGRRRRCHVDTVGATDRETTQLEKKTPRARQGRVSSCCAPRAFFVGLLLNARVTLLTPPSSAPSGRGSRIPLFSYGCNQSSPESNYRASLKSFRWTVNGSTPSWSVGSGGASE
jgi:hypothetical protein